MEGKMEKTDRLSIFYMFSWIGKVSNFFKGEYADTTAKRVWIKIVGFLLSVVSLSLTVGMILAWVTCGGRIPTISDWSVVFSNLLFWILEILFTVMWGLLFIFNTDIFPTIVAAIGIVAIFLFAALPILIVEAVRKDWEQLSNDLSIYATILAVLSAVGFAVASINICNSATPGAHLVSVLPPVLCGVLVCLSILFATAGCVMSFVMTIRWTKQDSLHPFLGLVTAAASFVVGIILLVCCIVASTDNYLSMALTVVSFVTAGLNVIPPLFGAMGMVESIIQTKKGNRNVAGIVCGGIALALAVECIMLCCVCGIVCIV